jgi:hypothetical protein
VNYAPSAPPTVGLSVVFSSADHKQLIIFDDLPLVHERSLFLAEIDLIVRPIRAVDHGLDDGIDDFAAVHGDFHAVPDFELPWAGLGFFGTPGLYDEFVGVEHHHESGIARVHGTISQKAHQ